VDDERGDRPNAERSSSEGPSSDAPSPQSNTQLIKPTVVYGKASVEKLIKVMFPARAYDFNGSNMSNDSEAGESGRNS
jgi:hypothetical protein